VSRSLADTLPGELELPLAFVNTLDVEDALDQFGSPTALRTWLAARGLVEPEARVTRRDLALAIELRDALRRTAVLHSGGVVSTPELEAINRVFERFPVAVRIDGTGEPRVEPRGSGVTAVLSKVVCDMTVARTHGTWDRLKLCPAEDCLWGFYDSSKNHSRRWCAMNVCGNRMKTREYRRRRAAGARGGDTHPG